MRQDTHSISQSVDYLISADPRLKLRELARAIGTDRHSIEYSIRERYGISFRELKKGYRMKRVQTLFEQHPGISIKQIAAEVGVTPNHLSHFIRSITGQCAREWRRHKS